MAGYVHCACGGCFEILVGKPGDYCDQCEDAGCHERHDPSDTSCQVEPPLHDTCPDCGAPTTITGACSVPCGL